MNILTRAIKKILGTKPVVRAKFDGASKGARSGSFHHETYDINDALDDDLALLRARSTGAWLNSPIANSAFEQWVSDEIGSTAKITPTSSNVKANQVLTSLWEKHERFLEVTGDINLLGVLSVSTRERRVRSEVFIRLIRRKKGSLPVPMQVQIIDSAMCPQITKTLDNGNKIIQGIEFRGLVKVAVWFKKDESNEYDLVRVPVRDVIHSFIRKFAGQKRGIPSYSPSLLTEGEYNSYEENELNRKASQSGIVGMITQSAASDEDELIGGEETSEGEGGESSAVEEIDPVYVSLGPNKLLVGEQGEGLELNNSPDVGQNYKDFTTNKQRLISSGSGVPMQITTGNFEGMNDRSLRQLNNQYRRRVKSEKNLATDFQLVGKLWRWFVDAAVLAGADIPDYYENRDDLRKYRLTVESFAHDHPVQDLTAAEKSIKLGLHSEKSLAEERGTDYEMSIAEKADHIAIVKRACEKAGITIEEYNRGK